MLQCCTVLYSISANAESAELNTALASTRRRACGAALLLAPRMNWKE
jgi:hypothetical protein